MPVPRMMIKLSKKFIKSFMISGVILGLVFLFYFNSIFEIDKEKILSADPENTKYTIVIDAGSTGSRIHVFKLFHSNAQNSNKFDIRLLNEELLVKVKPGLSSYSHDPNEAALSIKPLLDKALTIIPQEYHKLTKLSLKATAGLRLISEEIANKILKNIKSLFRKYPFPHHDYVEILDGKYEGIYSWLTLNYALGSYENSSESKVCSLDLGGGSTQITFVPSNQTLKEINSNDLIQFNLDKISYVMFAKSFLGFGLMSARMNIFRLDTLNFLKNSTNRDQSQLFSVCMPPNHRSKWVQQGIEYEVLGPVVKEQHSYDKCSANVLKTIQNKLNAPSELKSKEIFAFSYYFDRLNAVKMFQNSFGGNIKLETIKVKAREVCDERERIASKIDTSDKDYPFLCMDLAFIYSLFSVGYGIPNEKNINVYKEVNNMEISWALGAAFHLLNESGE